MGEKSVVLWQRFGHGATRLTIIVTTLQPIERFTVMVIVRWCSAATYEQRLIFRRLLGVYHLVLCIISAPDVQRDSHRRNTSAAIILAVQPAVDPLKLPFSSLGLDLGHPDLFTYPRETKSVVRCFLSFFGFLRCAS
jgi:hypothetical protein